MTEDKTRSGAGGGATVLPADVRRLDIDGSSAARRQDPAATTLVVGHGNDPAGAHVLAVAADLARRLSADLEIVHGVDLDDYPVDPDAEDWEEQAARVLDEQRREVAEALRGAGPRWRYHAAHADPVALITTVAEEHGALMIIIGTRGGGFGAWLGRLAGGSVSRGLLGAGGRPVLVVPTPS